ncbi:hypothetical protein DL98DRAFT_531588 [Cadophora sp. DSE1049]|nr:hypothetical protein DL98DRAFT_531588 [Cadophora sp. DSE1049]
MRHQSSFDIPHHSWSPNTQQFPSNASEEEEEEVFSSLGLVSEQENEETSAISHPRGGGMGNNLSDHFIAVQRKALILSEILELSHEDKLIIAKSVITGLNVAQQQAVLLDRYSSWDRETQTAFHDNVDPSSTAGQNCDDSNEEWGTRRTLSQQEASSILEDSAMIASDTTTQSNPPTGPKIAGYTDRELNKATELARSATYDDEVSFEEVQQIMGEEHQGDHMFVYTIQKFWTPTTIFPYLVRMLQNLSSREGTTVDDRTGIADEELAISTIFRHASGKSAFATMWENLGCYRLTVRADEIRDAYDAECPELLLNDDGRKKRQADINGLLTSMYIQIAAAKCNVSLTVAKGYRRKMKDDKGPKAAFNSEHRKIKEYRGRGSKLVLVVETFGDPEIQNGLPLECNEEKVELLIDVKHGSTMLGVVGPAGHGGHHKQQSA